AATLTSVISRQNVEAATRRIGALVSRPVGSIRKFPPGIRDMSGGHDLCAELMGETAVATKVGKGDMSVVSVGNCTGIFSELGAATNFDAERFVSGVIVLAAITLFAAEPVVLGPLEV